MRARLCLSVFVVIAFAVLDAQNGPPRGPSQAPVPANFIQLDLHVTRDGEVVDDLSPGDLEVLEDDLRQDITSFERVSLPRRDGNAADADRDGVGRQLASGARARVVVVFLDTEYDELEGSVPMRQALTDFLDRLLGGDDMVALMTPGMTAADLVLTRKGTVLANVQQASWDWARKSRNGIAAIDEKIALYDGCYPDSGETAGIAAALSGRRRLAQTFGALEDLTARLQSLREERKAVVLVSPGWDSAGPDRQLGRVMEAKRRNDAPNPFGRRRRSAPTRAPAGALSMNECETDRQVLALSDNSSRLRNLTERANRANVTFYPVFTEGLAAAAGAPVDGATSTLDSREDSLRRLASETDGVAIMAPGEMAAGVQRIADDLSFYYLLGYTSSNQALDGRFRTITVRTTRPGVQLRARRGYRGPTAEELAGGGSSSVPRAGRVDVQAPPSQFVVRASTWSRTAAGETTGAVWVVGELDYRLVRDLAWTSGATADVSLISASGEEIGTTSLDLGAGQRTFVVQLPDARGLAPGEYALRARVWPRQDGLPLSDTERVVVSSAPDVFGDGVFWRRGPSTGPQFLTTADTRFNRNERLRLEHPVAAVGRASARLLDARGQALRVPVAVTERLDASGGFRWIVAEVSLAPMAPGRYSLEVSAGGAKSQTPFQVVP